MKSRFALAAALAGLFVLTGCPDKKRQASLDLASNGDMAMEKRQHEEAASLFKQAIEKFRDNHTAWWGLGRAAKDKGDWPEAVDAFEQAARISDKDPMYQMWLGISLYEKAVRNAREDLARKEGKKPEQVRPDLTTINADQAIQRLQAALKLNPDMWRAHYQLGRIFRDQEKAKEAAESLTKAISLNPRREDPYVALCELYLRWDYVDEAIQVAAAGAGAVQNPADRALVQYELGIAYYNKRLDDKAIDAFTKALADKKDLRQATFQRGSAYFRKGEFAKAKADLEDFSKNAGTFEFEKGQASRMVIEMQAKAATAPK